MEKEKLIHTRSLAVRLWKNYLPQKEKVVVFQSQHFLYKGSQLTTVKLRGVQKPHPQQTPVENCLETVANPWARQSHPFILWRRGCNWPADRLTGGPPQQVGSRLEDDSFPFWGPAYFQGLWLWLVSFWEGRTLTSKNWIVSDLMKSHSLLKQTPLDIQWRTFIDGQKSVDQQGIFKTKMKRFITSSPYIYTYKSRHRDLTKTGQPPYNQKSASTLFFRKIQHLQAWIPLLLLSIQPSVSVPSQDAKWNNPYCLQPGTRPTHGDLYR